MSSVRPIVAMLRAHPDHCARCAARTEFVCWWHPETPVCLNCPCPECGERESWLGNTIFPFLILAIVLMSLLIADSIWEDQGGPLPPRTNWEAPWESTTASK